MRDKKTFPDPARWSHHTHAGTDCFDSGCPVNVEGVGRHVGTDSTLGTETTDSEEVGSGQTTQGGVPTDLDADVERYLGLPRHEWDLNKSSDLLFGLIAERKALREEVEHDKAWSEAKAIEAHHLIAKQGDKITELQAENTALLSAAKGNKHHYKEMRSLAESLAAQLTDLQAENAKLIAWQQAAAEERIVLRERLNEAREALRQTNNLFLLVEEWKPGVEPKEVGEVLNLGNAALTEQQEQG